MSNLSPPIGMTAGTYMGATDTRVVALAATLDDLSNASGGGAAAVRSGEVYAHLWAGVTLGSGQTTAVRTATFNALQAAINYAASSGKKFRIIAGTYEIYGAAGLVIPLTSGFEWLGSINTHIIGFYANAPVLTIGDTTGSNPPGQQKISGFTLDYGVSQTGNTSANLLVVGGFYLGVIENFSCCTYYGTNPPWIPVTITGSTSAFFFQNVMRDGATGGAQQTMFNLGIGGTGNVFSNLYFHNGSSNTTRNACAGPCVTLSPNNQQSDNIWNRINAEHCNGSTILLLSGLVTNTFTGLHFEDVQLAGSYPVLIQATGANCKFINTLVLDMLLSTAATNLLGFLNCAGYGEVLSFDGLKFKWSSYSTAGIASTFPMLRAPNNYGNDSNPGTRISDLAIEDDVGTIAQYLVLSPNLNAPLANNSTIGELVNDNLLPGTRTYQPTISASYTHYGQHRDAVLFVPASLPAATTITLSNKFKAANTGSTRPTPTGTIVRIRRQSGTYANTLTVTDAASATTLTTNSAAGADYLYQFNGTNWVAFS
jgi:hypothetical protein